MTFLGIEKDSDLGTFKQTFFQAASRYTRFVSKACLQNGSLLKEVREGHPAIFNQKTNVGR